MSELTKSSDKNILFYCPLKRIQNQKDTVFFSKTGLFILEAGLLAVRASDERERWTRPSSTSVDLSP